MWPAARRLLRENAPALPGAPPTADTAQAPVKFGSTIYPSVANYATASGQDGATAQLDPKFVNAAGGDFQALLVWWQRNKAAEHQLLAAARVRAMHHHGLSDE